MTYISAAVFPVLPGQADRVRSFAKELEPHMEEFERLNREAGDFRRFSMFLQDSPMGELAIYVFEVADPSKVRFAFTETDYDQWWLDWLRDVHGVDVRAMPEVPMPPPIVYDWVAP